MNASDFFTPAKQKCSNASRIAVLLLLIFAITPSCNGDPSSASDNNKNGGTDDQEENTLPDISTYKTGESLTMDFNGVFVLPYGGADADDYFKLVSRLNPADTHTIKIKSIGDKGITLTTPAGFAGGMFGLLFYKNGTPVSLGTTFVNVVDNAEVAQVPGSTVYGRVIDADGNPIPGVSVSDGVFVTATDDNGRYYISSMKTQGFVFITVPGGYRTAVNRSIPQFFRRLTGSASTYEQNNFILEAEDNARHRVIVFTDTHLANRTNDIYQFENGFKADLKSEIAKAQIDGVRLYAMALGDLTWDEYWYANSYQPSHYYRQMADLDIPIYSIPGNHDNDPYVSDDFKSEKEWRAVMGPTYYSFDIGDIHYIQMDNTLLLNTGASEGVIGKLNYNQGFTQDQLKWLEADLKRVPAGKTVVLGMHIQYTNRYVMNNGTLSWNYCMPAEFRTKLEDLTSQYDVHIVSGHTHMKYTNFVKDNIVEHNTAAVCATWWWTGNYTNSRCHIGRDGVPGGYHLFEMGCGAPNDITWRYQSTGKSSDYQFRAYDLNNCLITRDKYCPAIRNNFTTVTAEFFTQYANGYDKPRNDNKVLINVFDWHTGWQLAVRELETSRELTVTQVDAYDPLHTIHFNMNRMNTNSTAMTFPTLLTSHMFEVNCSGPATTLEITATDGLGRSYTETMTRPRELYDMSVSSEW